MTADGNNAYTWNTGNQLVALTPDGGTANTFVYDGLGRRQQKVINGGDIEYLYDQNGNLAAELTDDGGVFTATDLSGSGADELVCRYTQPTADGGLTEPLSAIRDINGSVVGLIADGGVMQASYVYEPYGTTQGSGAANGNSQQYAGRENDGTGLYFNRHRYYMPSTGRFISEDPTRATNAYPYASGNPVQGADPSGEFTILGCPAGEGAQDDAQRESGCSPDGNVDNPCSQCQAAVNECLGQGAGKSLCEVLASNSEDVLSGVSRLPGHSAPNWVGETDCRRNEFNSGTTAYALSGSRASVGCADSNTQVHEAIHIVAGCPNDGLPGSDVSPNCSAYDLAAMCIGGTVGHQ
jgi:RHS repeat-associated protein